MNEAVFINEIDEEIDSGFSVSTIFDIIRSLIEYILGLLNIKIGE